MPSPEKFHETLEEYEVGKEIIALIDSGFEGIGSKTKRRSRQSFSSRRLKLWRTSSAFRKREKFSRQMDAAKAARA